MFCGSFKVVRNFANGYNLYRCLRLLGESRSSEVRNAYNDFIFIGDSKSNVNCMCIAACWFFEFVAVFMLDMCFTLGFVSLLVYLLLQITLITSDG